MLGIGARGCTAHGACLGKTSEEDRYYETFVNGRRCAGRPGSRASSGARAGHEPVHRGRDRQHGRHPARRHRRGVESGAHRGESCRIHGRHGALSAGRSASRHLHHHVHAARLLDRPRRGARSLPAGFTATVDAVLSVGALEETVTVSGEAPVVDVQSISQAEVLDREVLDAIPTGRNLQSTAQLIPGVKMNRPEVGLTTAAQQTYMSVHGMSNRQTTVMVDGQLVMSSGGDGAVQNYNNQLAASGDGLRDERHLGRDPDRRRAHQHDPARGREHAQRAELLRVHREHAAGRQPSPAAEGSRSDLDRVGRLRLRPERRPRRADHPRQAVVLRQRPPVQHQRAGDRQLLQERGRGRRPATCRPSSIPTAPRVCGRASTTTGSPAGCCA